MRAGRAGFAPMGMLLLAMACAFVCCPALRVAAGSATPMDAFHEWLPRADVGIWVHPHVRVRDASGTEPRGVVATHDIEANTTILRVPTHMILTGTAALRRALNATARDTDSGSSASATANAAVTAAVDPRTRTASGVALSVLRTCEPPQYALDRQGMEELVLAAFLLCVRDAIARPPAAGDASSTTAVDPDVALWGPAVAVLPRAFDEFPSLHDPLGTEELLRHSSAPVRAAIDEQRADIDALWSAATRCAPHAFADPPGGTRRQQNAQPRALPWSRADFVWAYMNALTRRFAFHPAGGVVPYADLLNHHPHPTVHFAYDHSQRAFRMWTVALVRAGDELYDCYGDLSGAELMVGYGFVPARGTNPYDSVLLTLSLHAKSQRWLFAADGVAAAVDVPALTRAKKRLLAAVSYPIAQPFEWYASPWHPKSRDALAFCRFLAADASDLQRLRDRVLRASPSDPDPAVPGLHRLDVRFGVRIERSDDEHELLRAHDAVQWLPPLSAASERRCWRVLSAAAQRELKKRARALADDERSLAAAAAAAVAMPYRERMVREQRVAEADVLWSVVGWAQLFVAALRPCAAVDCWHRFRGASSATAARWADAAIARFRAAPSDAAVPRVALPIVTERGVREYVSQALMPLLQRQYSAALRRAAACSCAHETLWTAALAPTTRVTL